MNYKNLKTFKKLKFDLLNFIKIIIKKINKIFNLNYTKERKLNYIYNISIMIFTN